MFNFDLYSYFGLSDIRNYNLSGEATYKFIDGLGFVKTRKYDDDDLSEMLIGHREITYNNERKEIIIVSIRGTNDTIEEWSSNFDVGADIPEYWDRDNPYWRNKNNHKGFDVTANRLYDRIISYSNTYIDSDVEKVIYIVGHSRGGAIANILGSMFEVMPDYTSFTYTYASPNTTTASYAQLYETIFNIINEDDLITYLPISGADSWGFNLYGVTKSISVSQGGRSSWKEMFGISYNNNGNLKSTVNAIKDVARTREDLYRFTGNSDTIYTYSGKYYTLADANSAKAALQEKYGDRIGRHTIIKTPYTNPLIGRAYYQITSEQSPAFLMMCLANLAGSKYYTEEINVIGQAVMAQYVRRGMDEDKYLFINVGFYVAKKYKSARNNFCYSAADTEKIIAEAFKIGGTVHAHMPSTYYFIVFDSRNVLK